MIRFTRLGLVAVMAAVGLSVPAAAQGYPDQWTREMEARIRADMQRDLAYRRQNTAAERAREQRERALERAAEIRERQRERDAEMRERAYEMRERQLEMGRRQREQQIERSREMHQREMERALEMHVRELQRAQALREAAERRRDYITPPPGVRFRNRTP